MDKFQGNCETYLNSKTDIKKVSELEFYKEGYSIMWKSYEANKQEIHSLHCEVSILKHDLIDKNELNEKLKEEIGESLIKSEQLKKSNVTLQTKSDNLLLQNENLKCTIKTSLT
ncbi:Uncharacterized protein FWK35_00017307 [Aphis craccivora]|uniref:Uncharacterized protein n=1 Tax=Aphis craccivora TaxID=307492 RepID=A0A6G0Y677_APHCR|nr:Uncharacterized protein FWK35_00017307 [Aphis craccivora]